MHPVAGFCLCLRFDCFALIYPGYPTSLQTSRQKMSISRGLWLQNDDQKLKERSRAPPEMHPYHWLMFWWVIFVFFGICLRFDCFAVIDPGYPTSRQISRQNEHRTGSITAKWPKIERKVQGHYSCTHIICWCFWWMIFVFIVVLSMLLQYLVHLPAVVANSVFDISKSKNFVPTTPIFCQLRLIGVWSWLWSDAAWFGLWFPQQGLVGTVIRAFVSATRYLNSKMVSFLTCWGVHWVLHKVFNSQ